MRRRATVQKMIPRYLGALAVLFLLGTVLTRVVLLRRSGVDAMRFGRTDKSDYVIPPFAFFYFYLVFANAFGWPTVAHSAFLSADWVAWLGVASCAAGLLFLAATLRSFGESFRVGIDEGRPGRLVTTGVFGVTRNPIYVAFAFVLLGEFLIFSNWIMLLYFVAGITLFHRQVLREERSLAATYGDEYRAYRTRVRRYLW
jgi:protein-S-isoprenylcysteine O-methyltransferase Ste14